MRSVRQSLLAAGAAGLLTMAACTDAPTGVDGSAPATTEVPTGATTTQPPPESDGVLTIGVLLPQTGPGSTIGIPGTVAAELAVAAINETNVFDDPVRIVKADEGATVEEARAAIATLLDEDVDAVVGPASSLVAVEVLDELMDAGVVTCSPAATSIALDEFPDSDLFFRTVPSDSLAADAVATQAKRTGVTAVTLVYVDDGFGRPFARAVIAALGDEELEINAEIPLAANDEDFTDEAATLGESETGTIIVIADSVRGWSMLTALADVIDNPPAIIINDALRQPPSLETVTMLPVPFREAIQGVSPLATPQFDEEPEGPYATYSYDCVNLIALASLSAGSDAPLGIADDLRRVAGSGAGCSLFAECASKVEANLDIDYNGPSRRLDEIGDDGDPSRGSFATFAFDEDGLDFERGPLRISD